jgi:hypothetical protein
MKSKFQFLAVAIAIVIAGILVYMVVNTAAPTVTTLPLAALQSSTATPTAAPAGDVIPIMPLDNLTSLSATVNLSVDGLMDDRRTQGDLNAVVVTNDQDKSQITVTGSLLGQIAAQIGGSIVGLFTPRQADVFKVPEGTFVSVPSLIPICVKPNAPNATKALEDLSPADLMDMLTSNDVARGELVGEETLNGVPVKHYVINGEAFLQAAQNSSDERVREFAETLWSADDADLYIHATEGYPVAFRGSYSGTFEPLNFDGDFTVSIDLTGVNQNTAINLPASCNNPITP